MLNSAKNMERRVAALLLQAGLGHWRGVLKPLCLRYAGLEDVTIGMHEGASAEIVALLRRWIREDRGHDDLAFSLAIAELGFFDYQVYRVEDSRMTEPAWDPTRSSLAQFRATHEITAYPSAERAEPLGLTARRLLRQVQHIGGN